MYIAIDLIIAVVVAAVIISAWKRGFIRSVFQLGSTIASVVIAVLFYKELGAYFYDAFIYESVAPYIRDLAANAIAEAGESLDLTAMAVNIPEGLATAAETLGIDLAAIAEQVMDSMGASGESVTAIGENLAVSLSAAVADIAAFAALFFGALILLGLAGFLLDKVARLPILKGANRLLGFLLGIVEALILGMVLAKVAAALCSAYGAIHEDFVFTNVAENTYIAKFFLDICPF